MLDDVIAHLNAVNQPCTKQITAEPEPVPADQATESDHGSLTNSLTATRSTQSEESTEDTTSLDESQSTTSDSSIASTTSNRQLRPIYPISYNKKLLARLTEFHK